MKRGRGVVVGALCGAVIGVLVATGSVHRLQAIPFFAPDHALLAHRQLLVAGVAMWLVFGIYWEIAAKTAAAAASSESSASRNVHVVLANAAFVMVFLPIGGLGRMTPASPSIMTIGLAVEA